MRVHSYTCACMPGCVSVLRYAMYEGMFALMHVCIHARMHVFGKTFVIPKNAASQNPDCCIRLTLSIRARNFGHSAGHGQGRARRESEATARCLSSWDFEVHSWLKVMVWMFELSN